MFRFKVFLLFQVRATGERVTKKESILARERQFQQLVLVLAKCGKISNAQAAGSTIIAVLKILSQLSGKAMTAIIRQLSQLSYDSCLLWAEANEVKWVISDCWRGHLAFTLWIWLKNGKISLKGILLFWVQQLGIKDIMNILHIFEDKR